MKFSKKVSVFVSVFLVLLMALLSGSAIAGTDGPLSGIALSLLSGRSELAGNNLIFSYYDIRTKAQGGPGLSDNYFTVINKDDDEWIQAHVRVRTGQCSVELLDFDVLLSPNDVFTFDLFQAPDGDTVFASCDTKTLTASQFQVDANGCFVLDTGTFPNQLSLIQECGQCPDGTTITAQAALEATRWGYVEVIAEVEMRPMSDPGPTDNCTAEQLHAGMYNAYTWFNEEPTSSGSALFDPGCFTHSGDPDLVHEWFGIDPNDFGASDFNDDGFFFLASIMPGLDLVGRVYYATFDAERNLTQLSTSNATSVGFLCGLPGASEPADPLGLPPPFGVPGICSGIVLHYPCYSENSPGCESGEGELESGPIDLFDESAGYAYDAASTNPQGAPDMNYCFWKGTLTTTWDVVNKVGAAATFGPTQADIYNIITARHGNYLETELGLFILNLLYSNNGAVSHYFYFPDQGQTRYVFTFPLAHFTNQQVTITKTARYDTEENSCTIPTAKFISPGLPAPGVAQGEVAIIETHGANDTCEFNEGWIAFDIEVTDDVFTDDFEFFNFDNYAPMALGVVVNWGDGFTADVHTTAQMQWDAAPVSWYITSILSLIGYLDVGPPG
jgi:hypothetical protein